MAPPPADQVADGSIAPPGRPAQLHPEVRHQPRRLTEPARSPAGPAGPVAPAGAGPGRVPRLRRIAGMARAYDVQEVERRWQERWADERTYEVDADDPRPARYVLCMYPYPSGPAHQGHVRNYTFGDLLVRQATMQGYAVLSPFGFDSFGLPAENAAIRTGDPSPRPSPRRGSPSSRRACVPSVPSTTGGARCAATTPSTSAGTRSSSCGCSRPGSPTGPWPRSTGARAARRCWPTSRSSPTAPASARATWSSGATSSSGSSGPPPTPTSSWPSSTRLDWPERVKTMQRNWIGRSEGAEFDLQLVGHPRAGRCGCSPPGPTRASA